jgi:hypothetical protein
MHGTTIMLMASEQPHSTTMALVLIVRAHADCWLLDCGKELLGQAVGFCRRDLESNTGAHPLQISSA